MKKGLTVIFAVIVSAIALVLPCACGAKAPTITGDFTDLKECVDSTVTLPVASVDSGELTTAVTSPSKASVTVNDNKFIASEIGTYVITYTATLKDVTATKSVNVVVASHKSDGKTYYTASEENQYLVCSVCGARYDEKAHTHTAEGDYQYSATEHYQLCACGEKQAVAAHELTIGSDETTQWFKCDICGFSDEANKVSKNIVASFDSEAGINSIGNYPNWANFNFSIDSSVKYETEKGTLKVTVNEKGNFGYIRLKKALLSDVSLYDYIAFNVYNPTDKKITIQPTWGATTDIAADGWTQVIINNSAIAKLTDWDSRSLSVENVTELLLCIYYSEWDVGESFYVSSFAAYEKEEEPVAENVVAKFDSETDLSTVWSGGNRYTPDLSIDTENVHGEDKGSLKVTFVNENEAPWNSWVVLESPIKTDVSEYDYISFWVYCDMECHVDLYDATAYVIPAETWTEIKISTEDLANKKTIDYGNLTAEDISNMAIYLTWCDNYRAGDSIYISSITCGKNA